MMLAQQMGGANTNEETSEDRLLTFCYEVGGNSSRHI